jgi:hypothetical protein
MRTQDARSARTAWLVVAGLLATMLLIAGCGGGGGGSTSKELTKLGKGEGEVDLISWAGYVEPEWSKPFEQKTGCKVNNKVAGTSDEMVQLMRSGQYDGVSASGNATARLVDGGDVAPVNVGLVPNYKTIFDDLKNQPYNTFDGVHYGIPHGRGANLLMWNANDVKPAPDLHRRRGGLPEDPPAAARHRRPLRAERRTVPGRDPAARGTAVLRRRILVGSDQADLCLRQWRQPGRHHLAVPVLRPEGGRVAGRREPGQPGVPAEGGRDGLVGHLDDQLAGQAPQLHVHVDGLDRLAEGQRRSG